MVKVSVVLFSLATAISVVSAQQFKRLGACPTMGCLFPPDRSQFVAGAYFDVRVEVHAEQDAIPNSNFTLTIEKLSQGVSNKNRKPKIVEFSTYTKIQPDQAESWDFKYYKNATMYWKAQDGDTTASTLVHVASKAWRHVQIKEPGTYRALLTYNNGQVTESVWTIHPVQSRQAKNVILFIGDGTTTAMITAARLISQPHVNGLYQKRLNIDGFKTLGHVMTHSLDSLITDSANSASAYNTGHKSSPNALGVYPDSSPSSMDDPRQELLAELLRRRSKKQGGKGGIGIVTTAEVQDATPAAVFSHTRDRNAKAEILDQMIHGRNPVLADVILGGGGAYFHNKTGGKSLNGTDYYKVFEQEFGYKVVNDKDSLLNYNEKNPLLGIFHSTHMDVWLDRNVYPKNLALTKSDPTGNGQSALNQPNLDQMVIKGLEVLEKRHHDSGWFMMAEAASVDKQMHNLDYDRGLADLLELDSTIGKTQAWLKRHKLDKDTLIIVTADHGHGFDVSGSVDTEMFNNAPDDDENGLNIEKRESVGDYENSGWPSYKDLDGDGFPDEWKVRFTLAAGSSGAPDLYETFQVHENGPRVPATAVKNSGHRFGVYEANPAEKHGIHRAGMISTSNPVGVHSLTDVPLFATGPGAELFAGTQDNTEVFHKIAHVLGLGEQN